MNQDWVFIRMFAIFSFTKEDKIIENICYLCKFQCLDETKKYLFLYVITVSEKQMLCETVSLSQQSCIQIINKKVQTFLIYSIYKLQQYNKNSM